MTNLGQKLSKTSHCHLESPTYLKMFRIGNDIIYQIGSRHPKARRISSGPIYVIGRSGEVYVLKSGKEIPFRIFIGVGRRKHILNLMSNVLCLESNILYQRIPS
jgi:hypothetical protein